jgi:hypothetical protein
MVEYEASKLSAWDNKIGGGSDYTYKSCLHKYVVDPRENHTMDYQH